MDVVLYRNGNDSIAYHCDDTQEEELICTAIISCCQECNRPTIFKSKSNNEPTIMPHIKVVLHLQPGDVYYMNSDVQEQFVHGVEKLKPIFANAQDKGHASGTTTSSSTVGERLVAVCRYGDELMVRKDSGHAQTSLLPRLKEPLIFGGLTSLVLNQSYSKCELRTMNVHE